MLPKYLVQASWTGSGLEGLMKDGGTARQKAAEEEAVTVPPAAEARAATPDRLPGRR